METKIPQWKNEGSVNNWVSSQLEGIHLERDHDFFTESNMSIRIKESLKGSAKTAKKTNFGIPDFHIEKYHTSTRKKNYIPVVIENKLKIGKLIAENKDGVRFDDISIAGNAVNGALYYARNMISSGKYDEVVAIGVAGDNIENVEIKVYYVYGFGENSYKELPTYKDFSFLENQVTFDDFYKNASLSEEDKHRILVTSQAILQIYAKKLNKLMHNHNITAPQRVLYVSGMLLSMQDVGKNYGLTPDDLEGRTGRFSDGSQILNQIEEFLKSRDIPIDKQKLMLSSFKEISKDIDRDKPAELDKEVGVFLDASNRPSTNKQIFTFIYEYIYKSIDGMAGTLDIMGEMYSEFLKYALGDGKEIGIVLTPPYVTKMMSQILNINKDSKVMDLATGSAGFLIAAMELMIADAEEGRKGSTAANNKVKKIKSEQLLGVELNAEMFTLAATNMILRGDGSSNIRKGNTFDTPADIYEDFKATKLLLNPPFSYTENGMPFIAFGLDKMAKGGGEDDKDSLGAIIIQDSAGSGKAIETNKSILKRHTLKASIKMPTDLFMPMAGVQTSIYIFKAHEPHDFEKTVRFIDFRNDGYKRTKRSLNEIDEPSKRYSDIIKIYKAGKSVKGLHADWNLDEIIVDDYITDKGNDWNFDQHKVIDTRPVEANFRKTVADYLSWEVSQLLKDDTNPFA